MTSPATASELQKLLEQRNLYPWYAAANGTDRHDGYGLKREGGRWVVYRSAPMTASDDHYFSTEQEAVVNLLERMRKDGFAEHLQNL